MYLVLLGVCLPVRVSAYSGAPLCAIRPPDDQSESENEALSREAELVCLPPTGLQALEPQWTAPISGDEARAALADANTLTAAGKLEDALLALRVVEHALPRIADRIALRRAELLMRVGRPAEACEAYRLAVESPERNVAAQARIALPRCLLEAGVRAGETELDRVSQRYRYLIGRAELQLALARARERWGNVAGAVAIYRSIDLSEPESPVAAQAHAALGRIRAAGVALRGYTPAELVERAERIVQRGSVEAAHDAIAELLAQESMPALLKGRVHLLSARLARVEGRWPDVREEVTRATDLGVPAADALRLLPRGGPRADGPNPTQARADAEARIRKLLGGRPLRQLSAGLLRPVLDIALQQALKERATEVLTTMRARASLAPSARFDAAIVAFGVASDESVADLLGTLSGERKYAVPARYHRARALERLGRSGEAEAEYLRVLSEDKGSARYYAMWADLRLWAMESAKSQSCALPPDQHDFVAEALDALWDGSASSQPTAAVAVNDAVAVAPVAPAAAAPEPQPMAAATSEGASGPAVGLPRPNPTEANAFPPSIAEADPAATAETSSAEATADDTAKAAALALREQRERVLLLLGPVSATSGAAYPWLARAADLVELDLYEEAADEIGEAYLAWRDARGELRLRSGLEAVLTGSAPPRHAAEGDLRRQRLALDSTARTALGQVAQLLGDPGVSLRFLSTRGEMRPRAYAGEVEKAAAKYGVDPNLIFAVMRVESVYHRQIVSFAGAVGLMQIMPRTGMLIARKLGKTSFEVSDLLSPGTNVEFAAWYLASLIQRFDGSVPLALAAYNGGPHNVRLWMRENNPDMPLEAFLERIPFSQTHEYVRRVLTHYAAYRAQKNLPMARLDVTLPKAVPDTLAF